MLRSWSPPFWLDVCCFIGLFSRNVIIFCRTTVFMYYTRLWVGFLFCLSVSPYYLLLSKQTNNVLLQVTPVDFDLTGTGSRYTAVKLMHVVPILTRPQFKPPPKLPFALLINISNMEVVWWGFEAYIFQVFQSATCFILGGTLKWRKTQEEGLYKLLTVLFENSQVGVY